jgi:hypothetical protein
MERLAFLAAKIDKHWRIPPRGMTLAKRQTPERTLTVKPYKGKMMKRIFSLLGVALTCVATNLSTQTVKAADEMGAPDYRPFTLGLEASSTGPGVAADWRFAEHFGARAGVNGFFGASIDIGNRDIEGINYDAKLKLMSEPLAVDFYPWKASTFRVTVGILFNQNEIKGSTDAVPGQTFVQIGDSPGTYDIGSLGNLDMKAEQNLVAPYVSIGMIFYLDKQKHWSVGGELGVAYTGSPDVTLSTGSGAENSDAGLQQDLNVEAQQIEDGAWKFYPIVKVSVNYSF